MNIETTQEFKTIAAMTTSEVAALWKQHRGDAPYPTGPDGKPSKKATAEALAALVRLGTISLTPPAPPVSKADLEATSAVANAASAAVNTLGNQLAQTKSFAEGVSAELRNMRNAVASDVTSLSGKIDSLKLALEAVDTVARSKPALDIDQSQINAQVTQAIDAAFAQFKSAVVAAGAESRVAAALPENIESRASRTVFGVAVKDAKGNALNFQFTGHPNAPAVDDCFVWTAKALLPYAIADADNGASTLSNIWAGGEKGTGKTETARQFAARTGRPYFRVNFQKFTMLEDICGSTGLTNGSTEFKPGVLLQAWVTPYAVINLDELTLADPGVLGFLNGLLEPKSAITYGGQVWRRAPGVIVVVSDNTVGSGDSTGRYSGTRQQSAALVDRFGIIAHYDYLTRAQEIEAVCNHTGCAKDLAEHVLKAISQARAKVSTGEIIDAPSIRSVIAFIKALKFMPVVDAWNATIAARQPAESAVALKAIFEANINGSVIESLI